MKSGTHWSKNIIALELLKITGGSAGGTIDHRRCRWRLGIFTFDYVYLSSVVVKHHAHSAVDTWYSFTDIIFIPIFLVNQVRCKLGRSCGARASPDAGNRATALGGWTGRPYSSRVCGRASDATRPASDSTSESNIHSTLTRVNAERPQKLQNVRKCHVSYWSAKCMHSKDNACFNIPHISQFKRLLNS